MVDIVTACVLGAMFIATIWRPPVAYAAVATTYALEQWAQGSGGSYFAQHPQALNYAIGFIVLGGLVSALIQGKKILRIPEPVYLAILALFAMSLLSTIWSVSRASTLSVFWYSAPYLVTYSFATPLLFTEEKDFRVALIALILVSLFLIPALTFGTQVHEWGRTVKTDTEIVTRYGRSETRLNPLAIASYCGIVMLACVTIHLGKTSKLLMYASWAILPMAMYLIVRSGSRGQFIATVVAGMAVIKFSYPGLNVARLLTGLLVVAALLGLAYFTVAIFASGSTRFSVDRGLDDYFATRVYFSSTMIKAWLNSSPLNLLFGLGSSASFKYIGTYPHVQIIQLMTELGLVGLALAGLILVLGGYAAIRSLQLTKHDFKQRGTVTAYMAFFILFAILSFKQGSYLTNYSLYCDLAIIGKFAVIFSKARQQAVMRKRQEWLYRWHQTQLGMASAAPRHG